MSNGRAERGRQGTAPRTALIVVDVQNDFCEGGSLAVTGGADTAAAIRRYLDEHRDHYEKVVATRDWHIEPGAHYAEGEPDFQETWPVHCAADTPGAELHPRLLHGDDPHELFDHVVSKGQYDSGYSGFLGADEDDRPLKDVLAGIDQVHVCGIATDFCVRATSLDSAKNGFATSVLLDLCAAVKPDPTPTVDELIHGDVKITSAPQALVALAAASD